MLARRQGQATLSAMSAPDRVAGLPQHIADFGIGEPALRKAASELGGRYPRRDHSGSIWKPCKKSGSQTSTRAIAARHGLNQHDSRLHRAPP
jgi:hypothetical protein